MNLKIGGIVKIKISMFSSITYYEEVVGFEIGIFAAIASASKGK